jgi:imidazoleglycerol phosphate dehydratase HisB
MVGKFQMVVQCKAPAKAVYNFLASGAKTKMKVKSADSNALKVSLKSKVGLFSYGEIVDCTVTGTELGCRVDLDGRPVLVTNITADVQSTVTKVQSALVSEFGNR